MSNIYDEHDEQLEAAANPKDDGEKTMSLLGGVARPEDIPDAEFDFTEERSGSKLVTQGTLLVLAVFAIAAGSLYAMRLSSDTLGSESSTEVEARIEQALARLATPAAASAEPTQPLDAAFRDTNAILGMFSFDMSRVEVPIEFVKKNPFAIEQDAPEAAGPKQAKPGPDKQLERLRTQLSKLKLEQVMLGRVNIAVINGELLRTGDAVEGFRIGEITSTSVELTAGTPPTRFVLKMESGVTDRRRR